MRGELTIQVNHDVSRWEPKTDGAATGDSPGFCEEIYCSPLGLGLTEGEL